jgi:hypothetical protein
MSEGGFASRGEHAHAARGASHDRAVGADPYSAEQARRDVEPVLAAIDAGLAAAAPAIDEAERCERRSDYERAKAAARGGLERAARELRGAEQLVRRHAELQAPVVAARERLGEAEARAQAIVARRDEALARWQREHPAIARGARAVFSDRMPDTAEPAPAGALPHREAILAAFGRHDVSGVPARVGGTATGEADALGAEAFTRGGEVAFAEAPGLHTAAHEAAHVMQQRLGVVRHAGVGPAAVRSRRTPTASRTRSSRASRPRRCSTRRRSSGRRPWGRRRVTTTVTRRSTRTTSRPRPTARRCSARRRRAACRSRRPTRG